MVRQIDGVKHMPVYPRVKQVKVTERGIGDSKTPFTQAYKYITDLENESTLTEIMNVSEQLIEACRHVGGIFCFECGLWDETGLSWEMSSVIEEEVPTNTWICGACSLGKVNNEEEQTEEDMRENKVTVPNRPSNKIDTMPEIEIDDFAFDIEVSTDTSSSEKNSQLASLVAPLVAKSSTYSFIKDEQNSNLVDMPFKANKKNKRK